MLTSGLAKCKINTLAVWPFDTKILSKLSSLVFSAIAGLIINVLVKTVLQL